MVYDEYGPVRMIRTPHRKYVHRYPEGPHELYDLAADPGERVNLMAGQHDAGPHPALAGVRAQMAGWFVRHGVPDFDGAAVERRHSPVLEGMRAKLLEWSLATGDAGFLKRLVLPASAPPGLQEEIFKVPFWSLGTLWA